MLTLLFRLADMHSYFLNHYLVTSIILEIHMLLTMLVLEPGTHDSDLVGKSPFLVVFYAAKGLDTNYRCKV